MARGDQNHSDACALSTLTDFWFTAAFGETMRCTEVWAGIQYVLFQVWNAANRICAKRLLPFPPTLLEALERHEHLHLTEECGSRLLAMSAATAVASYILSANEVSIASPRRERERSSSSIFLSEPEVRI